MLVVRVHGRHEEMFVPGLFRGQWKRLDPVYRTWFVNVAITDEHAKRLRDRDA
ncbi:hypothetical protein G7043_27635 [Lentzea sp. NEAU-D13]|uniref:Uncharacterized protein n=1 Tax=Lentzea alba TaxID=2714351 RepID=A0A7C9VUH5_9PSEU|nr:hypothetical protein [Lentzea alba]NGY62695.1 hypothetical protein [Lentzea alba]